MVSMCMNVRLWWQKFCAVQLSEYQNTRVKHLSNTVVDQRKSIEMLLEENRTLHKIAKVTVDKGKVDFQNRS